MPTTKVLGWGKCSVKEGSTTYEDIVDGSTSLEVDEGEEMEALIEGGEVEGRKKKADKYTLTFNRRIGDASEAAIGFTDNVASVQVIPELVGAIGVTLTNVTKYVSVKYDSTDGLVAIYTYKTKGVTDTSGALTDISFAAKSE